MTETNQRRIRRWVEGDSDSALDQRLQALFQGVPPVRPLDASQLAAVRMRLQRKRSARTPWLLRHALLLGIGLLTGTGFALANFGVQRWMAPAVVPSASVVVPASSVSAMVAKSSARQAARPAPTPSFALSTPVIASGEERQRPSPEASRSQLGRESELLTRALARLRSGGNPAAALELLDEYRRQFPEGALRLESDIARLDAFLALGRRTEALALLDQLPIDRIGRGPELRVVRAELRAREDAGRAVRDFDAALAVALPAALEERALFGRAASRLRSGDSDGARTDFSRYLQRYPSGRFAAEARAHTGTP
jgi:tetratricopeptide (TPR) repeat protein